MSAQFVNKYAHLVASATVLLRGIILISLSVIMIYISIFCFGAFRFQQELALLRVDGQAFTVGQLSAMSERWQAQDRRLSALSTAVENLERSLADATAELLMAEGNVRAPLGGLRIVITNLTRMNSNIREPKEGNIVARTEAMISQLKGSSSWVPAPTQTDLDEINAASEQLVSHLETFLEGQARLGIARLRKEAVEKILLQKAEELRSLTEGWRVTRGRGALSNEMVTATGLDEAQTAASDANGASTLAAVNLYDVRYIDLYRQILFFNDFPFGRVLVGMPSPLLIPLLTIAMGALGSVVILSIGMLSEGRQSPLSYFIFRPILGAITGFLVFILVQAGVLVAASGPAVTDTINSVNPYFVSFVAIISGMLSEQAIDRIKLLAAQTFNVKSKREDEEERLSEENRIAN